MQTYWTFKFFLLTIVIFLSTSLFADLEKVNNQQAALFSGRISRLNEASSLVRIKVDFENFKFLNKKDRVEFWEELNPNRRCLGYIEARSSEYMLLKIPEYNLCIKRVHFTTGSFLKMYSPDLEKNISIAQELVKVLLKKRLALNARKRRLNRELDIYTDKMEAINKRFEVLKQKLELEWFRELSALDEDKTKQFKDFKNTEARLDEVDHKLQVYKIKENNFKVDRWSLDSDLYLKK
jgi:hypothetical protein